MLIDAASPYLLARLCIDSVDIGLGITEVHRVAGLALRRAISRNRGRGTHAGLGANVQ